MSQKRVWEMKFLGAPTTVEVLPARLDQLVTGATVLTFGEATVLEELLASHHAVATLVFEEPGFKVFEVVPL